PASLRRGNREVLHVHAVHGVRALGELGIAALEHRLRVQERRCGSGHLVEHRIRSRLESAAADDQKAEEEEADPADDHDVNPERQTGWLHAPPPHGLGGCEFPPPRPPPVPPPELGPPSFALPPVPAGKSSSGYSFVVPFGILTGSSVPNERKLMTFESSVMS